LHFHFKQQEQELKPVAARQPDSGQLASHFYNADYGFQKRAKGVVRFVRSCLSFLSFQRFSFKKMNVSIPVRSHVNAPEKVQGTAPELMVRPGE
jgi:hypothetical protein